MIIICNKCVLSGSQYSSVVMASEQVDHHYNNNKDDDDDDDYDDDDNGDDDDEYDYDKSDNDRWTNLKFRSRATTKVTTIRAVGGQGTGLRKV